jgi:hypothetical protein
MLRAVVVRVGVGVAAAGAADADPALLPRAAVDTRMPVPSGRTVTVAAGGDLQRALNAAQPGDVVVLAPGATFVGNFVLPAKPRMTPGGWITVRSGGALPAEGTRVRPADAAAMPKILTPNAMPALATAAGTQGWRLVGLEIAATPRAPMVYAIVSFGDVGDAQRTADQIPSRIVLDRSYVHGTAALDVRRCVALNSATSAVIDSHLADCHSRNSDSQAIVGWNGPGPYKIANNYLEGGHEVVMFGGGDPDVRGLVPSDIEIRRNHVTRPTSWNGVWPVKNLLEVKNGQRILAEGNVFENNWVSAQNGFAFVWIATNQDGRCSWCVAQDITFRYNRVANTPHGFNLTASGVGSGTSPVAQPARRITIEHNVVTGPQAQNGRMFQINGPVAHVTIAHNTAVGGAQDVLFVTPDQPLPTFVFRNNVTGGTYTLFADGGRQGAATLAAMSIPPGNVAGNVFALGAQSAVPPGNTFAPSLAALGIAGPTDRSPASAVGSAYATAGVGRSRPGADVAAVAQRTAGVVR